MNAMQALRDLEQWYEINAKTRERLKIIRDALDGKAKPIAWRAVGPFSNMVHFHDGAESPQRYDHLYNFQWEPLYATPQKVADGT